MVHGSVDQDIRLARSRLPLRRAESMHASGSPWVPFAVNKRQSGVTDIEGAVLVNVLYLSRLFQVERISADD